MTAGIARSTGRLPAAGGRRAKPRRGSQLRDGVTVDVRGGKRIDEATEFVLVIGSQDKEFGGRGRGAVV